MARNCIQYLFILVLISACGTYQSAYIDAEHVDWAKTQKDPNLNKVHSLYLIGDAGAIDDWDTKTNYVLESVKQDLKPTDGSQASVVYLGDNLYSHGLEKEGHEDRERGEQVLAAQCEVVADSDAPAYFIPGNHDWNRMSKGGLKRVKRQEDFLQNYYADKEKVRFYPSNGCGDPKELKVTKNLVFIFIDTQWWLQDWDREKKMNKGCEVKTRLQFIEELKDIVAKNKNKQIVILGHHPHYSNGHHNGGYSLKEHLFPLSELKSFLYLPLPVIGSLYPIFRTVTGAKQDIPNVHYQDMIKEIQGACSIAKNVIYASGHEHCLEYYDQHDSHFVVSGSGSRVAYAKRGGDADFVYAKRGYATVDFYENGSSWLEFFTVTEDGIKELVFSKQIVEPREGSVEDEKQYPDSPDLITHVTAPANDIFAAGGIKKVFLGAQYRDMWSTPVKTPVIDLANEKGGLVPIKKGGGLSSNSLRLSNPDGNHYILRSINKDYRKLLPENFKNLKAVDIMKDQNSASHPYGALMLPSLSRAAGIYYTQPRLVYLKHQKQLGNYNELFPEEHYLFEDRPSGDWGWNDAFGNSEEIISYIDVLNNLHSKKSHFVDQEWVLKSRLFDIWIHDWDRHDDQWRWASFEEGDKTIYRPIPRDRDQAFYKFGGVIPGVIGMILVKKFRGFKDKIPSVPEQSFNARHFDRYFLNELDWQSWEQVAKDMQGLISEQDILEALEALPQEARQHNGDDFVQKLMQRKADIVKYAREHYEYINKEVQVTGSDNKDRFYVERKSNGTTEVRVMVSKDGEDLLKYQRQFDPKVTREIRLFGLNGKDEFHVSGNSKSAIRIRIIGGEDDDKIYDTSKVGGGASIVAYDMPDGMKIETKGEVRDNRKDELEINEYNREFFKYNTSLLWPTFGFSPDDGFWIGIGISAMKHGWRKDPFASRHSFVATIAPGSRNAFQANYMGVYKKAIGKLDFAPSLYFNNPSYINYFGLGNLASTDAVDEFNWVRITQYGAKPLLRKAWNYEKSSLSFGPTFNSYRFKNVEGRILDDNPEFMADDFERKNFIGAAAMYEINGVDSGVDPGNGIRIKLSADYQNNLSGDESTTKLGASAAFYLTLIARPKLVFASHAGYSKVLGDPEIYQYADIGNSSFLRGYRNQRFRGESAFYHQNDLRLHLFNWHNNVLPMSVGITGGYDYGRVWLEDESFDGYHDSWSVGLSMNILDLAVIHPFYSSSVEADLFNLRIGFAF